MITQNIAGETKAKLKVDIIADEIGGVGGASSAQLKNIVTGLSARDVDVRLFGFKHKFWSDQNQLAPYTRFISRSRNSSIVNSMILCLKALSIGIRPDSVIHVSRPAHALPFLRRRNAIVAEVRGQTIEEMKLRHSAALVKGYDTVEGFCLKRVDSVIAVDPGVREYITQRYKIDQHKIGIIPIGVDLDEFKPYQGNTNWQFPIEPGRKIILYVGRLDPVKNISMLLEAFKKVLEKQDCHLLLVGTGKEEETLRTLANTLGIADRVVFAGFVPHEDIPQIMSSADVFAFSSLNEGSPHVTKEAIACGLPVVSTNVGDVFTYLESGASGYIVDRFDPSLFAAFLLKAIENREALHDNCLRTRELLSIDKVLDQYETLYRSLNIKRVPSIAG